jgi:hypothetical protein
MPPTMQSAPGMDGSWSPSPWTYGAKGKAAEHLLQRMAPHSVELSPEAFLIHAESVLSVALQVGNAGVASAGPADLHLQALRRGGSGDVPHTHTLRSSLPGRNQQRRAAQAERDEPSSLGSIVHADFQSYNLAS